MSEKPFNGVMTPLMIPLNEREQIMESELRVHINNMIKSGVHAFLSPSSTGEFANLHLSKREKVLKITADETNGRIPVVALIGECGTKATLINIDYAQASGADAIMATPPYYYPLDQKSILNHFIEMANHSELPLWLYHQPNDTKLLLEHETLAELAKHPNIIGIKVSTNDMLYYYRVVRMFQGNTKMSVLMGEDHSLLPALSIGGNGVVSFLSNIIPETIIQLCGSIGNGDLRQAQKAQSIIMDCFEAFFTLKNHNPISACKLILKNRGVFSSEITTAPFPALCKAEKEKVIQRAISLSLLNES